MSSSLIMPWLEKAKSRYIIGKIKTILHNSVNHLPVWNSKMEHSKPENRMISSTSLKVFCGNINFLLFKSDWCFINMIIELCVNVRSYTLKGLHWIDYIHVSINRQFTRNRNYTNFHMDVKHEKKMM